MDIPIVCHNAEIPPSAPRSFRPGWIPASGDHAYRGSTRYVEGVADSEPCYVCGGDRDDPTHGLPWRTCSWCGSIHPQDLHDLPLPELMSTVKLGDREYDRPNISWADFKYGYPHKLYINYGPGRDAKFYSRHLLEHWQLIPWFNDTLGYLGVTFERTDDGLKYRMLT
jgi:hypothetical protein